MNCEVIPTDPFKRDAKRLAKKYPSFKNDLAELEELLSGHPTTGIPLGGNAYKIRLRVKSKGKGKSGAVRVVTYYVSASLKVYLLSVYDKADFSTITDKSIKAMIRAIRE